MKRRIRGASGVKSRPAGPSLSRFVRFENGNIGDPAFYWIFLHFALVGASLVVVGRGRNARKKININGHLYKMLMIHQPC